MVLEDVRTEVLGCSLFLFEKVYNVVAPFFGRTPIGQVQDAPPDHPGLHSAVMAVSIALWAAAALALLWFLLAVVVPFALRGAPISLYHGGDCHYLLRRRRVEFLFQMSAHALFSAACADWTKLYLRLPRQAFLVV